MNRYAKTILLADDEEDLTWSISRSIQRDNKAVRVLCANTGDEAIWLLKNNSIDVLVTDLRMPGTDGFSIIRYVSENFLQTKIIVMTAYGSSDIKEKILNLDCYYYIEKPFEISTLKQKIYSVLENNVLERNACGNLNNQIKEMLLLTQKTPDILLTIYKGKLEGKLYSSYGKIYHAKVGKKQGITALHEILHWKNGLIRMQSGVKGEKHSIHEEQFN